MESFVLLLAALGLTSSQVLGGINKLHLQADIRRLRYRFFEQGISCCELPFPIALVAQLVEQVTLNHRVQGSSPCGGTSIKIPGNLAPPVAISTGIFSFESASDPTGFALMLPPALPPIDFGADS